MDRFKAQSSDDESTVTGVTASSSGLTDSNVAILCDAKQLAKKVEDLLTARKYTISKCFIAGREKILNEESTIHHANKKVILLTKGKEKDLQERLVLFISRGYLTYDTTLLLVDDGIGVKDIRRCFSNMPRMRLAKDVQDIVQHISYYIEAGIEAEQQNMKDEDKKKELFASLLLSVLLSPKSEDSPQRKEKLQVLAERAKAHYGGFRTLQVGNLKGFLQKSQFYNFDETSEEIVVQTQDGYDIASNWFYRVNNSTALRSMEGLSSETGKSPTKHSSTASISSNLDIAKCAFSPPSTKSTSSRKNIKQQKSSQHAGKKATLAERSEATCLREQPLVKERTVDWVKETAAVKENVQQAVDLNTETIRLLSQHLSNFDSRFGLFLIASRLPECDSGSYEGVANIPWLRVFDFDSESRCRGLLLSVEQPLSDKRNLTISTLCDPARKLSDRATDWLFMRGLVDKPDTIIDERAMQWFAQHNKELEALCSAVVEFCFCKKLPIFLILWYDDNINSVDYLEGLLTLLTKHFEPQLDNLPMQIVLCIPSLEQAKNNDLERLIRSHSLEDKTITISITAISKYLGSFQLSSTLPQDKVKLPKRREDEGVDYVYLNKVDLSWINDYVELLPLQEETVQPPSPHAGEDFVRGGTITWEEIQLGNIAVDRAIQEQFLQKVRTEYIEECRSTVINIYHTPGGGGTTFGRQVLWKLHKHAPCGLVIPSSSLSTSELAERLELLHGLTQLPVVLLIDGGSEYEVDLLYVNRTFAVIILHVKRYNVQENCGYKPRGPCYLPGRVTKKEAERLSASFSKFAPQSRNALHKLSREAQRGLHKQVFEFGLTAFNHEFKGVKTYVSGYLEPHSRTEELPEWKKIVLYLSILKYFGQVGMPAQVFESLVQSCNRFVSLDDVHHGKYFIIESQHFEWRINYHAVAKEVIENLLGGGIPGDDAAALSDPVKTKLHKHVIDFIRLLGTIDCERGSKTITDPIYNTILKRDYQDVDANDSMSKTKRQHAENKSRLLDSVEEMHQLDILQELVKAFPTFAEFHAHLGRYLSLSRKFDEADESLQHALNIRDSEKAGTNPKKTDNVRARIHHMFGNSLTKRILHAMKADQLGRFSQFRPRRKPTLTLEQILVFAKKAIENFTQGRKCTITSRNYFYVGEVKVRLLVVELALSTIPECIEKAFNNTLGKHRVKLAQFLRESHSVCDHLLVECHNVVPQKELCRLSDYTRCVSYFYQFFGQDKTTLQTICRDEDASIPMRRSNIATIKAKYFEHSGKVKSVQLPTVHDIADASDIQKIIGLHEKTITDVSRDKAPDVKISNDMQEWIDAIRHPSFKDTYTLEEVHCKVEMWNKKNEFGYSLFYLYVITFLLTISCPGKALRKKHLIKLKDLYEQVRSRYRFIGLKRGSKEILADHNKSTIGQLIPAYKADWDKDNKKFKNSAGLKVCTGTVIQSDKPLIGFISLDVDYVPLGMPLKIYFVPKPCGLYGNRFSNRGTRVEFFTGFSIDRGVEALQVKELEKRHCPQCHMIREIITLNQAPGRGACVRCREEVFLF